MLASDWIFRSSSYLTDCQQGVFARREISKSHVRAALVVFDPPGIDEPTRFGQCLEPMDVEAFVPQGLVGCLDEGVVCWLARAQEVNPDRMVIGTEIDEMACKPCAIVGKKILQSTTLPDKAVQRVYEMFPLLALADFNSPRLSAEGVDDRQCPKLVAIAGLVMDEVQAPDLVRPLRPEPLLSVNDHFALA
jgi:hypothetical protein